MSPVSEAFADGCSAFNDGEPRKAPGVLWRFENGTEVVASWIAGWDYAETLKATNR